MSKTIIHVNQRVIKSNLKHNKVDPVLTVKNSKENTYTSEVIIRDGMRNPIAKVIYSPDKPLSCGARVWIEVADSRNVEIPEGISWSQLKLSLEENK